MALRGLTVAADGSLRRDSARFRNIGANWPTGLCPIFGQTSPTGIVYTPSATQDAELDAMEAMGIRVLRVMVLPIFPNQWTAGLLGGKAWNVATSADREVHYEKMDALVAKCRERGMGIIWTMFWRLNTIPDLVGQNRRAWLSAGNTRTFAQTITEEIVTRYLNEEAVYGYGFANELNHYNNSPEVSIGINADYGTAASYVNADNVFNSTNLDTPSELAQVLSWWYNVVRAIDPDRLIVSGNGPSSYWQPGGTPGIVTPYRDWLRELQRDNPLNSATIHFYGSIGYCSRKGDGFDGFLTGARHWSRNNGRAMVLEEIGNQPVTITAISAAGVIAASSAVETMAGDEILILGTGTAWDGPAQVTAVSSDRLAVTVTPKAGTWTGTSYVNPIYGRFSRMIDDVFSADLDLVMIWQFTTQAVELSASALPYSSFHAGGGNDWMIPIITAKNAALAA